MASATASGAVRLLLSNKAQVVAGGLCATSALGFVSTTTSAGTNHETVSQCEKKNAQPSAVNLQQRMTAIGHFSVVSETEYNPSIVTFVMGMVGKEPLTAKEFGKLWKDRGVMERHERFHQKIWGNRYYIPKESSVQDRHPVEDHLHETVYPVNRAEVISRMTRLQTTSWDLSDSLWRIWIAPWGELGSSGCVDVSDDAIDDDEKEEMFATDNNNSNGTLGESLLFFQGHHALADGASMSAAFMDVVDEADSLRQEIFRFLQNLRRKSAGKNSAWWQRLYRFLRNIIWFTTGTIQSLVHQTWLYWSLLWDNDPWSQVRLIAEQRDLAFPRIDEEGEEDVIRVERNLSWSVAAPLEQVKWIAQQLGGDKSVTVNDVFCACITAALARQLDYHRKRLALLADMDDTTSRTKPLPQQSNMHIALPVHLKGGVILPGESVGNNLGAFVVRLPGETPNGSSEDRLLAVHEELATIKKTPIAILSHLLAKGLSYSSNVLPSSLISWLFAKSNAGSIAVVSNNRGLPHHVHLNGRRIDSMYGFVPLPPGIPVGVVVMSYAGNVSLTITAEPWAVPDADQFLIWVLEEYMQLLEAAKSKSAAATTITIPTPSPFIN